MFAYPVQGEMWIVDGADFPIPGNFVWPFPPENISSEWGYRPPPIPGLSNFHSGVDWAASAGTPIKCAGAGTVLQARGKNVSGSPGGRSWGNRVIISHGNYGGDELYSGYAHMQDALFPHVQVGDVVAPGQVIGYVGSTGASTGNHLHFTTFIGGLSVGISAAYPMNSVNPRTFMATYNPNGNVA